MIPFGNYVAERYFLCLCNLRIPSRQQQYQCHITASKPAIHPVYWYWKYALRPRHRQQEYPQRNRDRCLVWYGALPHPRLNAAGLQLQIRVFAWVISRHRLTFGTSKRNQMKPCPHPDTGYWKCLSGYGSLCLKNNCRLYF